MAVTANGTPYVESSDLVANYPGVSLALANHIDDNTGKILQVVRAIVSTSVSTTSTSFVDITGLSVTITPQKATSAIMIITTAYLNVPTNSYITLQITDSSNVAVSGAQASTFGMSSVGSGVSNMVQIGYATPGTTSPVTYKGRFQVNSGTGSVDGNSSATQIYAIEVSA